MKINKKDLKIETMRGSTKAGGQHLNKTDSCVRVTHLPTGISVIENSRNQHQNKKKAIKKLEKKLRELEEDERARIKKSRRDKVIKETNIIRTYDYKLDKVTDHRTGKSASIKDVVKKGKIDLISPAK